MQAITYTKLPIKVIVIKNNTLGMIRWEQIGFLGNTEFGVEFTPIDWVKFAEACGGKGYAIREPNEVKSKLHQAMKESKPTIIEAYVDPFEPPMPPKVEMSFVNNLAESFARGQPYASRIGLTLFKNQVQLLVGSVESAPEEFGFGQLFVGAIIAGLVGNAAEHSSAIILATRNKLDPSIGIAAGSGTQVALFVAPVLVIVGIFIGKPLH